MNGGSRLGRSCCGTSKEPCNQSGSLCGQHTPTHAQVWEVLNFDWWELERAADEVLAQDRVVDQEMDCFGDLVAK